MSRAERRQELLSDVKMLRGGVRTAEIERDLFALCRALHAKFSHARSEGDLCRAVGWYNGVVDATNQSFKDVETACKRGCAHCCVQWVGAFAPEVLHLAEVVRRKGPEVVKAVRTACQRSRGVDHATRSRSAFPCPLLASHRCSAYEARPTTCRTFASTGSTACAAAYREIISGIVPVPAFTHRVTVTTAMALGGALRHARLPCHTLELHEALDRALGTDGAAARWLGGEDVFAGVSRDPGQEVMAQAIEGFEVAVFGRRP